MLSKIVNGDQLDDIGKIALSTPRIAQPAQLHANLEQNDG